MSGKAAAQESFRVFLPDGAAKKFEGGGYQVRFRDFDENWIIESGDLEK